MKRLSAFLMFFFLLVFSVRGAASDLPYPVLSASGRDNVFSGRAEEAVADLPLQLDVKCRSALLMDAGSGKVLMAKNEHERRSPASVTKIMSLLLICEAIEEGKLRPEDELTASPEACAKGGSQIWLEPGEVMTVDDLLKATCVFSANDACALLGEAVAGSEEGFVGMMNRRAVELGMQDTHFENCTGLDDTTQDHLTSAYDVAIMSRALLHHEIIKKYSTIYMDSLRDGKTQLVNTNKLVRTYKGITGLKTGTTDKAGCCISATAERDGLSLIAVVLGADNSADRFSAAKSILDLGFNSFECYEPDKTELELPAVEVVRGAKRSVVPVPAETAPIVLPKGEKQNVTYQLSVNGSAEAPIEKGQTLGTVRYLLGDELLAEYRLTAPEQILRITIVDYLRLIFDRVQAPTKMIIM